MPRTPSPDTTAPEADGGASRWSLGIVAIVKDGEYYEAPHEAVIYCDDGENEIHVEGPDARDNAALILLAINDREALLDLLREVRRELYSEPMRHARLLDQIDAALASVALANVAVMERRVAEARAALAKATQP